MTTLLQASNEWATRPADQRFTSLHAMEAKLNTIRQQSSGKVVSTRSIFVNPGEDHKSLEVMGKSSSGRTGFGFAPTNWAFGQLAQLVGAPASYLRTLPAELAADALNYGLAVRDVDEVGLLLQENGTRSLRAATGPNYGRIWNDDLVRQLIHKFGDGVTGDWKVPGEFGHDVAVTSANTTLFASDRDMFVFLCDEKNRIDMPNRRDGKSGSLARGFFLSNSEVGKSRFYITAFLFDYVCCNRMVWGAELLGELSMNHTKGAPDRFIEEALPLLSAYASGSAKPVQEALAAARSARIETDVEDFLAKRFGRRLAPILNATHVAEEGRPIETLWDAATAVTAYARGIEHQDVRVDLERQGGELLTLAQA